MARLWDTNMADKATAIEQAEKLGGVVVRPRPQAGFAQPSPPREEKPHGPA